MRDRDPDPDGIDPAPRGGGVVKGNSGAEDTRMKRDRIQSEVQMVRSGYDKIAKRYVSERESINNSREVAAFCTKVPSSAKILDVGCGTGIPIARDLVKSGFEVIGIDSSSEMVSVARQSVQGAKLLQMDMTRLGFQPESFDGLISCYAIFHVPRSSHADLFQSFHRVLKPDGIMLASVGTSAWEGVEDYHGVNMYWSHFDSFETQALVVKAGFHIEFGRNVDGGGETHHWILATKEG
jgi:ubiquinone/menaquinone biosynthesis C-methylase UbiE